jgi:predicted ATPase/DNA-binding CsgD family transcriptional regulator
LAEVKRLLSAAHLVTLTGVGGVGKTRLAVRVGSELGRAYPDGVWHVELGTLADPDLVAYAVVETLHLRGATESSAARLLTDRLADRELLLVLDNCEHLLDACARLAVTLLESCPGLRILCTSRQALGVAGEKVFTVEPLAVAAGAARAGGSADGHPALRLFVERAVAVAPGFTLGSHNQPVVADICARLDGLPLAIELAAARLRTLTVEQLADALTDRFAVLAARYAVPSHHRRLRDTFGWSFELCSAAERLLWARLTVFGGSFDLDAAVAVCASDDLPGPAIRAAIGGLVEKSIVVREERTGQVRYRLLETVREYGRGRLPAGDSPERLPRRHRDWYLRLAERFDTEWFGPDQVEWANRIRTEWTNLRAALGWCLTTPGEAERGQLMAGLLHNFWSGCGAVAEGRHWLDRAVATDPGPTLARVRAMSARTRVLITQADYAAATASAEEAVSLAHDLDDPYLLARTTYDAGMVVFVRGGDLSRAQVLLEEGLTRFAAIGTAPLDYATALMTLALAVLYGGDPHRAQVLCAECDELSRRRGDRWWRAFNLRASAEVAYARGAFAEGERQAQEALGLHHLMGTTNGMVAALDEIAYAAAAGGDPERAARLLGASSAIATSLGQDYASRRRYWRGREGRLDDLRSAVGENAFDTAFEHGGRMDLDDTVRYALRAADAAHRPRKPIEASARSPLTPREREVAELVAQGLSNHEIATRLVVSRRTAESHVENILRKLGFTSRAQVATWITQLPA